MVAGERVKRKRGLIRTEEAFEGSNVFIVTREGEYIEGVCLLYGKEEIHLMNMRIVKPNGDGEVRTRYGVVMKNAVKIIGLNK